MIDGATGMCTCIRFFSTRCARARTAHNGCACGEAEVSFDPTIGSAGQLLRISPDIYLGDENHNLIEESRIKDQSSLKFIIRRQTSLIDAHWSMSGGCTSSFILNEGSRSSPITTARSGVAMASARCENGLPNKRGFVARGREQEIEAKRTDLSHYSTVTMMYLDTGTGAVACRSTNPA